MTRTTDYICKLIQDLNDEDRRAVFSFLRELLPVHPLEQQWGTTAEAILTAIARSSDLTLRGVRGILAEATFENAVLPQLRVLGWSPRPIVGNQTNDFVLERSTSQVRIQVKLQRREAGVPKEYSRKGRASLRCPTGTMHVVEVQKTRSGQKKGERTRPCRFGDFDVLAVNLHPSTGNWGTFMYTVGSWLLPRPGDQALIEIFQPVPITPDDYWTDDLVRCIEWFSSGKERKLYT